MNKYKFSILLFFSLIQLSFAENRTINEDVVIEVFNKIVLAYGSPKSAPQLVFSNKIMGTPAIYYAKPTAKIVIDKKLFDICKTLNEYALDAVAIIISHELAHYYNDHTFCSDFAFVMRNESKNISDKLKTISKSEKIALETEADLNGLFYATSAGYNPFFIYEELSLASESHYFKKPSESLILEFYEKLFKYGTLQAKQKYQ
jgi:predicted SprT family Zn-dependent metalloprotease